MALLLYSCDFLERKGDERALARVHEQFLYPEDIEELLIQMTGRDDSARIVTNYVQNWVRERLLLDKAELNLPDERKDFSKQLENYRNSLIIYAYERELIRQRLDTVVGEAEIEAYFNDHQQNFELKENIVKATYVKLSNNAPKIKKVRKLYKSEKPKDMEEFRDYCLQYAVHYYAEDTTWIFFDDLLDDIPPLEVNNKEQFLKANKYVEVEDSLHIYLLHIRDFKIKNSVSPLSFERKKIRNIIINHRKLSLINTMKEDLYRNAFFKGDAEILEK